MNFEMERTNNERQCYMKNKVVFIGEQNVGKSSVITRFMINDISRQYVPTIGIDFFTKNVDVDDAMVRLQIWDTAGQERFRSLIPSYLRDADVVVIVFDVTCGRSFARTMQWFDYVNRERRDQAAVILVGNKCDLKDKRQISIASGIDLSNSWQCPYFDVSAHTGENIKELFMKIAQAAYAKCQNAQQQLKQNGAITLVEKKNLSRKYCYC